MARRPSQDNSVQVDVLVASNVADVPTEADMQRWLIQAITHAGATGPIEVSVKVVDEEEGRSLNRQYRARDYATNVLSFPLMDAAIAGPPVALGDIVICAPVITREASEQGLASSDHWAHMLVHGALHLLGYDHETSEQAVEMESLEALILADGGVQDPYATEAVDEARP